MICEGKELGRFYKGIKGERKVRRSSGPYNTLSHIFTKIPEEFYGGYDHSFWFAVQCQFSPIEVCNRSRITFSIAAIIFVIVIRSHSALRYHYRKTSYNHTNNNAYGNYCIFTNHIKEFSCLLPFGLYIQLVILLLLYKMWRIMSVIRIINATVE